MTNVGGKAMGNYMYFFVSTGGSPYWPMPYRWGYGWNYLEAGAPRGYKIPLANDQQQINAQLPAAQQTIIDDAASHPLK